MEDPMTLPPETQIKAHKVGTLSGILLVVWSVAFSLFKSSFSPLVFWTVLVGVGILLLTIPMWLLGQRVKREYLQKQAPPS
jgi:hypothetical protein